MQARLTIGLVGALTLVFVAQSMPAQLSTDEAYRRLQAKQAAASTQPSVKELTDKIAALEATLKERDREIASLKQKLARQANANAPVGEKHLLAQKELNGHKQLRTPDDYVGVPIEEVPKAMLISSASSGDGHFTKEYKSLEAWDNGTVAWQFIVADGIVQSAQVTH